MEVEIKLMVRDVNEVKKRIIERGAKFVGKVKEVDVYFNYSCEGGCCRNFAETDEAIRLRKRNDQCFLTYKGPRRGSLAKTREELETNVGSCEIMQKILEKLCLVSVAVVSKEREYWKLDEFTITIDNVEGVGTFVEVELEGDESVEELLRKFVKEIVPEGKVVDKTYLEMVIEKQKT